MPVFAFFAAGVAIGGWSGLVDSLSDRVAIGIVAGLVVGKTVGIYGTTFVMSKVTRADLDPDLRWLDVLGVSMLAGIGFTVSLLIGDLAFGEGSGRDDHVKVAVLCGSLLAAVLAGDPAQGAQPRLPPHRARGVRRLRPRRHPGRLPARPVSGVLLGSTA